jgi:hypothetical protein
MFFKRSISSNLQQIIQDHQHIHMGVYIEDSAWKNRYHQHIVPTEDMAIVHQTRSIIDDELRNKVNEVNGRKTFTFSSVSGIRSP